MYDIIILGSGPAGLTAALYTARANKKTLVLGGDRLGGQTAGIATLENYPGWAGSGLELAQFMQKQCETFGATIKFVSAKNISLYRVTMAQNMRHVRLLLQRAHPHVNWKLMVRVNLWDVAYHIARHAMGSFTVARP